MTDGGAHPLAPRTIAGVTPDGTAYVEAGAGPALILVHGVGMNHRVWTPQLAALAGEFHIVAYDLLGHGDSALPPESTDLAHLSDQLADLLDHCELGQAHLVGHSMGALVAIEFALRHPERVDRLVALNAVYERSPAQRASVARRARALETGDLDEALQNTIARWFGPDGDTAHRHEIACVRDWLQAVDPRGYARVYRRFATADDAFVGRLAGLKVPVLFATGEHDPNSTPEMSRRMARETPSGQALTVAGERHMMAFVAAETVNPILRDFLQPADRVTESLRTGAVGDA